MNIFDYLLKFQKFYWSLGTVTTFFVSIVFYFMFRYWSQCSDVVFATILFSFIVVVAMLVFGLETKDFYSNQGQADRFTTARPFGKLSFVGFISWIIAVLLCSMYCNAPVEDRLCVVAHDLRTWSNTISSVFVFIYVLYKVFQRPAH